VQRAFLLIILGMSLLSPACAAAEPLYVTVHVDRTVEDGRIVVAISGKVTKQNQFPVVLAAVSIEVNDPYGSSVHIAFINSGDDGSYSDTFQLESNRSPGNYTIYVTASKPGYQDAQAKLTFSVSVTPYIISVSPSSQTVKQGDSATFRVILESKGQISSIVHIEVIEVPASASHSLSSDNVTPPSTVILRIDTSGVTPGSYRLTVVARSGEGESTAYAKLVIEQADKSGYYLSAALIVLVTLIGILLYRHRRRMAVKLIETPSTPSPQYLEGLALSPSTLLSLPDHLRKTAIILCNLKEASANDVAARSGRARAAESDYLNQLVRMGFVKKKRKGRESYFFVE
jgi:hypothetical protein